MTEDAPEFVIPFEQLLIEGALGSANRWLPGNSGVRFLDALAKRPDRVKTRVGTLVEELGRIVKGTSQLTPPQKDRRFTDPEWSQNPLLKRIVQAYLATHELADGLLADAPMEWRDAQRMKFVLSNILEAAAPSNNPLISPVAWKTFFATNGSNTVSGPRNLVRDFASSPRIPAMVEPDAFHVGVDLGITPGAVVYRTEMFELIQYLPQTETVREVPLLIVPPTINKYYVLDLAPDRSLVEFLVRQGQQVFMISWRNPDERHRDWGIDAYAAAVIDAFSVVDRIADVGSVHTMAACSGGLIACMAAAHRVQTEGIGKLASLNLLVTMIDQNRAGMAGSLIDEGIARAAIARSQSKGYLDGRALAEVFAWLRPSDLVWNYWVNNYLQGKTPPRFDILFWNADTTRMPAALHRDFIQAALHNKLATAGAVTVLGTPIDLHQITVDSYVVAGSADHICPWTNCYRSSQLLGGKVRFVLSTNGHIAALVNPPGNRKSSYQVSEDNSRDPADWRAATPIVQGSWWPDYAAWLGDRSGRDRPATAILGNADFRPLGVAPGAYVFAR
ncbi:PHA/PHB synthase family protein [Nocardia fluminea]|uniref:Polyhydroxyalkanoate synthase n=1 Tax=Nocardia fluminea TaxID=134984 RepID=A0A2N3VKA4_9NOCA|nr:alpha/beta fold hydrolase [Nocardia fluminea]PKV82047.1 polyhydroxyalkanoate synthase [Nocardia fluminea]